jgi:hypothetical protein
MISKNIWELREWRWSVLLLLAAAVGCSRTQSPEARVQMALADAGVKGSALYRLAGTVTVDGMPPESKNLKSLVVVLHDPQKPDEEPAFALVRDDGHFNFSQDGVEPGHYVFAFAVLRRNRRSFLGPDKLNNLYNDPDVNAKDHPELVIDHQAPGKTDYLFNLEVAGKEPNTSPGPHAVTKAAR